MMSAPSVLDLSPRGFKEESIICTGSIDWFLTLKNWDLTASYHIRVVYIISSSIVFQIV